LEARVGFEPTDGGFADLSLRPLGYRAESKKYSETGIHLSVIAQDKEKRSRTEISFARHGPSATVWSPAGRLEGSAQLLPGALYKFRSLCPTRIRLLLLASA